LLLAELRLNNLIAGQPIKDITCRLAIAIRSNHRWTRLVWVHEMKFVNLPAVITYGERIGVTIQVQAANGVEKEV
jgi:hypothetical protein